MAIASHNIFKGMCEAWIGKKLVVNNYVPIHPTEKVKRSWAERIFSLTPFEEFKTVINTSEYLYYYNDDSIIGHFESIKALEEQINNEIYSQQSFYKEL